MYTQWWVLSLLVYADTASGISRFTTEGFVVGKGGGDSASPG